MRTWIVASDLSPLSRRAREYAIERLTALGGGRLIFAYVHIPTAVAPRAFGASAADADTGALEDIAQSLHDEIAAFQRQNPESPLSFEVHAGIGRPADQIAELASKTDAEQIVVGSHGRRGIERMLLGSVAERLVRLSPCVVVVIKGES